MNLRVIEGGKTSDPREVQEDLDTAVQKEYSNIVGDFLSAMKKHTQINKGVASIDKEHAFMFIDAMQKSSKEICEEISQGGEKMIGEIANHTLDMTNDLVENHQGIDADRLDRAIVRTKQQGWKVKGSMRKQTSSIIKQYQVLALCYERIKKEIEEDSSELKEIILTSLNNTSLRKFFPVKEVIFT